ncbi:hypothetical protein IAI18_10635 [Acetobacteraceae bacterium H6797]|nr:hypothetical protein [Acetobacteraceae bacterium H6797]
MATLTTYARDMLSRALCGRAPALPAALYLGLGTGGSDSAGLTGEPNGSGYARQRVVFTGTGAQRNAENLRWAFSAGVGTLTHCGLFDAATGGNALTFGPMDAAAVVSGPGTVTIAASGFTMSAD